LVEYNYLLSSQLEKQRIYFQQRLRECERERAAAHATHSRAMADATERHTQLTRRIAAQTKKNAEHKARVSALQSQFAAAVAKTDQLKQLNVTLTQQQSQRRQSIQAQVL
jgi:hypothetical protein